MTSLLLLLVVTTFAKFVYSEEIITIEKVEDLAKYGFYCYDAGLEEDCTVEAVSSASVLPSYYPESYRNLPGDYFMYVNAPSTVNGSSFRITSDSLNVTQGTYIMFKAEYYTETQYTMGYMVTWADAGIGFFSPGSNSTWKNSTSNYVARAAFNYDANFLALGDRNNSLFAVFKKFQVIINPAPQIQMSITNLEDFTKYGINCSSCTFNSVNTSASNLPTYFPSTYKNLPLELNETLMYVEPKQFYESVDHEMILYNLPPDVTYETHNGYVTCRVEFYIERVGDFGWGKTYGSWSPYGAATDTSVWEVTGCQFYHLDYYLMYGNKEIGFFAYNDKLGSYSVFKKLEIDVYYFEKSN